MTENRKRAPRLEFQAGRDPARGGECGKTWRRLVYATRSLLAEENEDIVAVFLADHGDYRILHCQDLLMQQEIALDTGEFLRLLPHLHGTDAFFAAALQRGARTHRAQADLKGPQRVDGFLDFTSKSECCRASLARQVLFLLCLKPELL